MSSLLLLFFFLAMPQEADDSETVRSSDSDSQLESSSEAESSRGIGTAGEIEQMMREQWELDADGNLVKIKGGQSPAANPLVQAIVRMALRDRQIQEVIGLKQEIRVLRGYIQFTWLGILLLFIVIMWRTARPA